MTLEGALELIGAIYVSDPNDPRYSDEGDDFIWENKRFWYEDIETEIYDRIED